jgi:hypothetical protein
MTFFFLLFYIKNKPLDLNSNFLFNFENCVPVAHLVHQELVIKCVLSKGPPMLCYKYESRSILDNLYYKLYYGKSIIIDQTVHNIKPDIVILYKTIKEAYLLDVGILNGHSLQSIITEKLQK